MNEIKYWYYKLTHSILCFFGWHRLITWGKGVFEGGDDKQCWCCEEVGGGWIK